MEALCLGIDLYQEKITLLPQVPFQSKKRKQILLPLLKELLNRYIDFTFKENNSNNISNNSSSIHISNSNNSLNIINESDDDLEIKINENEEKIKNFITCKCQCQQRNNIFAKPARIPLPPPRSLRRHPASTLAVAA